MKKSLLDKITTMFRIALIILAVTLWPLSNQRAQGGDAPTTSTTQTATEPSPNRDEVKRLIEALDNDQFDVRQAAAKKLDEMTAQSKNGPLLSSEFQRALLQPDLSYEVRMRLQQWKRRLPKIAAKTAIEIAPGEIDQVVQQLNDNSYAVRLSAKQRLESMLDNPKAIVPLLVRLKERLADPASETQSQLESAWKKVRNAWLLSDGAMEALPPVSDAQIRQWVSDLARPASNDEAVGRCHVYRTARRELFDLLTSDADLPRVTKALQAALNETKDAEATARLQEVLDMTKQEMVAEYWSQHRHLGEQHLVIGVPMISPDAPNPSHFDQCDEHKAHCVQGNSLSPGDYPVGAAFPHPKQENAFFYLVNLPTPRRRMAYLAYVQTDETKRLAVLSRRTLDRWLEERRSLSEPEVLMLSQLDAGAMSRFADQYLLLVDDARYSDLGPERLGGRSSCFSMICTQLAVGGTKEAAPGLIQAIDRQRVLPPIPSSPYRTPWLAALSIATRDPWPEVDAWLAKQIHSTELLADGDSPPSNAEFGATAAAILLKRHGQSPANFNLQAIPDPVLLQTHVEGYRFADLSAIGQIEKWWAQEKQHPSPAKAAP
jgi:hypothetical protein